MRLAILSSILMVAPCFGAAFQISVDTSSLPQLPPNNSGFIDFTLNGGFTATAMISNYSNPGGTLNSGTLFEQDVIGPGTLPGTVTLGSSNSDYNEGITFGSSISFLLTLTGTPSGNTGDVFNLSFFSSNDIDPLLTQDLTDGEIVQFQLDPQGDITVDTLPNPAGGPSFATVTAVPEPASWPVAAIGLLVLFLARRRETNPDNLWSAKI